MNFKRIVLNNMEFSEKVDAFHQLGTYLTNAENPELQNVVNTASRSNTWFTPDNIANSLAGALKFLHKDKINTWLGKYDIQSPKPPKQIGLVMAGNIPMVGLHDFLCVLLSGHIVKAKMSKDDSVLIPFLAEKLFEINPAFRDLIHFQPLLKDIDAVIATGSDNSARYFGYYFSKYPNIIRKNRSSCAVLNGDESKEDFEQLGQDIFQYFGLGCRNISKLFVPKGYNFDSFFSALNEYITVANHHKYHNNYDYNKSIYLVNKTPHLDNGFLLLTENKGFVSPISVLFYEHYESTDQLDALVAQEHEKIQCIVSKDGWYKDSVIFGKAQFPEPWDYADNIDTMEFLINLK